MPTYERVCRDCGGTFEQFAKASQLKEMRCPCGSANHEPSLAQLRSVATHGREVHGIRRQMHDIIINPAEVAEARREFAGVPATITDDGKVFINSKDDRAKWHRREQEIHAKAQAAHAANDEREKRGEPIVPVVKPRKKRTRRKSQA